LNHQPKAMTTNSILNLSVRQLKQAVAIKERIAGLEKGLGRVLRGGTTAPAGRRPRKKRTMGPAARARIAAAQRARWAKLRRRMAPASRPAGKAIRRVSAAVRAKLAKIARKRWAKVKAAGRKSL
jgi:hypothetical protein